MFGFVKNIFSKVYETITVKVSSLWNKSTIDEQALQELEEILLSSDAGVSTTRSIMTYLKKACAQNPLDGKQLKAILAQHLEAILTIARPKKECSAYLLVGINGSGKTTFAAKLAHREKKQGKKVLLIAGDTFRAAATEQLKAWAHKIGVDIVIGSQDQDPASVIYQGLEKFSTEEYDSVVIDTAGRVQTKVNLMKELEKIKKVVLKKIAPEALCTLLTVDAMLGQNSLEQARTFHESTQLDGVILTKLDGTGKGGIVFAISEQLKLPITCISYGEKLEDFSSFDPHEYVNQILG